MILNNLQFIIETKQAIILFILGTFGPSCFQHHWTKPHCGHLCHTDQYKISISNFYVFDHSHYINFIVHNKHAPENI